MKRIFSILLLSAMLFTGLVGCESKPVDKSVNDTTTEATTTEATTTTAATTTTEATTTTAATTTTTVAATTKAATTTKTTTKAATTTAAPPAGKTYTAAPASLTGTISFSGSTSVYPVAAALTEAFKIKYPNVKIHITNVTGSGAGLADANAGNVSFGMRSSAWDSTTAQKYSTIVPYQIAIDGVAIVVNTSSSLTNVTFADIKNVYGGTALGDISSPISRESGSGTRTCFEDIMKANGGLPTYVGGTISASTEAVGLV